MSRSDPRSGRDARPGARGSRARTVRSRRRRLVVVAAVLVTVGVAGGWWLLDGGPAAPSDATAGAAVPTTAPAAPGGTTDPSGPPPAASPEVSEPADDGGTDAPGPAVGDEVLPVITQAGWAASGTAVEVAGFVPGVVEDGGTCRVTLTHDGETLTGERAALADATTTACGVLEVGAGDMTSGWWQAVLSYESPTSRGSSAPVDVLVPTR